MYIDYYCKSQCMTNWSAYNNSLVRHRNIPFRSNLLTIWNAKSKIVSTRGHFNLQTGELSSTHNIGDYDYSDVPGFDGKPCPDNNELAIYIH